MNDKKKVDILFCGLVRTPELFKKSVLDMVSLRNKGFVKRILFSTWKGEVQKNPEIHSFLKKKGVFIIESDEPEYIGKEVRDAWRQMIHGFWCQMKSQAVGLGKIEPDRFVLKTRTDVYINPKFLEKIFTEKENLLKIKKDLPKGNIFKYKIWVPYYELKTVFHLADECYFGYNDDLKLLINEDVSYDTKYKMGSASSHIRKFIHPFLRDYPVFYDYLKKYARDGFLKSAAIKFSKKFFDIRGLKISRKISKINKFEILKKNLKDDKFIDCLAAYYSILYSHFYIDSRSVKNQIIWRPASIPSTKLDPKDIIKNLSKEKAHPAYSGVTYVYDMELLENLCNRKLKRDPISVRLMKAVDKFSSQ